MSEITRVGVDLAKNLIQVHAVDVAGKVVTNRLLKRDKFIEWCMKLPAKCLLAMESCSGAHYWSALQCWRCSASQPRARARRS